MILDGRQKKLVPTGAKIHWLNTELPKSRDRVQVEFSQGHQAALWHIADKQTRVTALNTRDDSPLSIIWPLKLYTTYCKSSFEVPGDDDCDLYDDDQLSVQRTNLSLKSIRSSLPPTQSRPRRCPSVNPLSRTCAQTRILLGPLCEHTLQTPSVPDTSMNQIVIRGTGSGYLHSSSPLPSSLPAQAPVHASSVGGGWVRIISNE
jgi:hypothetical protein